MKLASKILLTFFLVFLIGFLLLPVLGYGFVYVSLFNATQLSYNDSVDQDGFQFLTREEVPRSLFHRAEGKKAALERIDYDPAGGVTDITIPDCCGDYPVVGLGGYYGRGAPCPFAIELKGIRSAMGLSPSNGSFGKVNGKKVDVIYHDVTLNLGPNIKEIFASQTGFYVETESDRGEVHVVRIFFNCDPSNQNFYAENGRLYDKKGKLVEGFFYWDEDFSG